jgi:hypothetical protein
MWCTQSSQRPRTDGRRQRNIGNPARCSACEAGTGEEREKESCSLGSVRSDRFPKRTVLAEGRRRDTEKGLGDGRGRQLRKGGSRARRARRLSPGAVTRRARCAEANEIGGGSERQSGQRT